MKLLYLIIPLLSGALAIESCDQGYCCDGEIIAKQHNGDLGASNLLCCQGGGEGINLANSAPTTCTSGKQIPLTQASKEASGSTSAAASASASSSSSANAAAPAMITNGPLIGAAVAAGHFLLG